MRRRSFLKALSSLSLGPLALKLEPALASLGGQPNATVVTEYVNDTRIAGQCIELKGVTVYRWDNLMDRYALGDGTVRHVPRHPYGIATVVHEHDPRLDELFLAGGEQTDVLTFEAAPMGKVVLSGHIIKQSANSSHDVLDEFVVPSGIQRKGIVITNQVTEILLTEPAISTTPKLILR